MRIFGVIIFTFINVLSCFSQTEFNFSLIPASQETQTWNQDALNFNDLALYSSNTSGDQGFSDDLMVRYRLNQAHKIAGYSTLVLGAITGILGVADSGDSGWHQGLGIATASMSAVTLGLGYASHRGEFRSGGTASTADKVHALLGITGGVMMMITPFLAPSDAHAVVGGLGFATMGLAVAWEWFF